MATLQTSFTNLRLIAPNPPVHAPITLSWFTSEYGRETLQLMGNAEHEISVPTLANETQILEEFVDLEKGKKQLTWMIQFDHKIIGVAWIELVTNHNVRPPSVHLMIGDKEYRGKGVGKATMIALIRYIKENIETATVYSRHLKSNVVVASMNQGLGFTNDGHPYTDDNGLEWQNVKLVI